MNYETQMPEDDSMIEDKDLSGVRRKGGFRPLYAWLIVAAVLVLAGFAYLAFAVGEDEGAVEEAQLPAITVISPGKSSIQGEITATGTIAARREMPVGVVGEGGRVISVPVDAGDWVRQGQVLAVIDRSVQQQQASALAAQIDVAKADAELAQANLDRALKLVDRGFISKADVDRLTATRDSAVARVKVAQAQYRETRARNARLNIVAPAAGLLLERNVEPGQTVSAGTPTLFSIARGGEMEVLAQVSEVQLASLAQGVTAAVTPTGSDKSFEGQVWQVSPVIDPQSRQGFARIALPYDEALRPGGFATATIQSGTAVATLLPESAVLSDDEGSYVYVIDKDNKAQRRGVKTGSVTANGIIIREGISGQEQIVLRAGGFLTEGETVKPVKSES